MAMIFFRLTFYSQSNISYFGKLAKQNKIWCLLMQMKKLLVTIAIVFWANQVGADVIRVNDVFYCTEDEAFDVSPGPDSTITKYKLSNFKLKVNEGNITFGSEGKLADKVFFIDQPYVRALHDGEYTDIITAYRNNNSMLMLSSQQGSSLKLMYSLFGIYGKIMGLTASCDKF